MDCVSHQSVCLLAGWLAHNVLLDCYYYYYFKFLLFYHVRLSFYFILLPLLSFFRVLSFVCLFFVCLFFFLLSSLLFFFVFILFHFIFYFHSFMCVFRTLCFCSRAQCFLSTLAVCLFTLLFSFCSLAVVAVVNGECRVYAIFPFIVLKFRSVDFHCINFRLPFVLFIFLVFFLAK